MYAVYTSVLALGLVLSLPVYLLRFRKYGPCFLERLGFLDPETGVPTIWIHAVSVGEARMISSLIAGLRRRFAGRRIVVSTITSSGRGLVSERGDVDRVFYFPLDLPPAVRRSLDRIRPALVIVAETEIWPNFLRECSRRNIPVFMVNGRISDKSYPRYRIVRHWLGRVLGGYRVLGMQSATDAGRIRTIGAPAEKVAVFGNLKYDLSAGIRPLDPDFREQLRRSRPLLVAASTTEGEESVVLDAFRQIRQRVPALRLLIAPRHPERFAAVAGSIAAAGFQYCRRTSLTPDARVPDVLLLDTIGELAAVFEYATLVFVGGSLAPRGGHNILEPALFSRPVLFGPHMENFREMSQLFLEARAAIQVSGAEGLVRGIDELLSTPDLAAEIGGNARRLVEENAGATERFLRTIDDTVVLEASG